MKGLIAVVVVLVVLIGGLLIVDRVSVAYADTLISQQMTSSLRLSQQPTVRIQGFPFLTQWASGDYSEIDVTLPSVTSASVTVNQVTAIVTGVKAPGLATSGGQFKSAMAQRIVLSGVVPLSEVPLPSGFQAHASGNQLQVTGTVSLLGLQAPVTAVIGIHLSGSTVTFDPTSIQVAGSSLSPSMTRSLTAQFKRTIDIGRLPFSVSVTGITVTPSGLAVTATASNVPLSPG
ncbi:MAG: DUF2993 domain-containing protein [Candidatus Dormiibacterota bacterium]